MRRLLPVLSVLLFATALTVPSTAYAQQSVNFYLGGFIPSGTDDRVNGDVLFNDQDFFLFRLNDFRGVTAGGDWLIRVTDHGEVGLGAGIYSRTVPSIYANLVQDNGANIRQDLKLRTVPFTASFRFLPFGHNAPIQPYIGGGVGVIAWRYSETGDFVDFNNNVFHDRFVGSGSATGPLVLGGVRVPAGSMFDVGLEIRHQSANGKLNSDDFAGATKIDLGGFSYLATFNIRF